MHEFINEFILSILIRICFIIRFRILQSSGRHSCKRWDNNFIRLFFLIYI